MVELCVQEAVNKDFCRLDLQELLHGESCLGRDSDVAVCLRGMFLRLFWFLVYLF